MSDRDDEIITVKLPRWKVEMLDKIVEERQAYDLITSKFKSWWFWTVAAGLISLFVLWDKVLKVGA